MLAPVRSGPRVRVLAALSLLYTTQGIPLGLAAEYLPVVLRKAGYGIATIAALSWLQLPWQLKVLWADAADRPFARARARAILLALQLALAATVASYAAFELRRPPVAWLVITALAALFAASQDVFVDAFAVRLLGPAERGAGNVAQVAGYRLGILAGGAGLLVAVGSLGATATLLALAGTIAVASIAAFFLRGDEQAAAPDASVDRLAARALAKHLLGRETWPVLALACTYTLGLHVASVLIKPMVVDAGWSERTIGLAVVSAGTAAGLVGAAFGGLVHRLLGESRALAVAGLFQAVTCLPLTGAALLGVPRELAIGAIALEHFASGAGTTVLFAALRSATRPANAALHYTVLTSANALAIGLGGVVGGVLADRAGFAATYLVAGALAAAPLALIPRWRRASAASAA